MTLSALSRGMVVWCMDVVICCFVAFGLCVLLLLLLLSLLLRGVLCVLLRYVGWRCNLLLCTVVVSVWFDL